MSFTAAVLLLLVLGLVLAFLGGGALYSRVARLEAAMADRPQSGPYPRRPQQALDAELDDIVFEPGKPTVVLFATAGCVACDAVTPAFDELSKSHDALDFVVVSPSSSVRDDADPHARRVAVRASAFSVMAGPLVPSVTFRSDAGTLTELGPVGSPAALSTVLSDVLIPT